MKKALIFFLALTVGAFMAFAVGCEEPVKEEEEEEAKEEEKEPVEFEDVELDVEGLVAADMELEDGTYEATGEGFGGDITVEVTIEEGEVASVEVVDHGESTDEDAYPEAPSVNEALEVVPERIVDADGTENVDGISAATETSTGIASAVEAALQEAAGDEVEEEEEEAKEEEKDVEGEVYTGSGEGYKDAIEVEVTMDGEEIVDIQVTSEDETPDFFEDGKQTINDIIEAQGTDVDTETGATGTSEGIVEAVEDAVGDIIN